MFSPAAVFNTLSAVLGAAICAALVYAWFHFITVPAAYEDGFGAGQAAAKQFQQAAVLSETLRQREGVRAAEEAFNEQMSALAAQIDAARPGREQEILQHEHARASAGRGCPLSPDDAAWLLGR